MVIYARHFKQYFLSGILLFFGFGTTVAQSKHTITPAKEQYGIDQKNKIAVWSYDLKSIERAQKDSVRVDFDKNVQFNELVENISYNTSYGLNYNGVALRLYLTELPIVKITVDSIKDEPKTSSVFSFSSKDTVINAIAGIEYRGNISLKFPKKTFDLEFWQNSEDKKSKDLQFLDLREDDDWILDGLYNEPLRLRSYMANKLWVSIHKPNYLDREENAKSGIDLSFVEVFLNDKYIGVHALMEQVDRKLLQLKKYENGKIKGELFKASSYDGAPSFRTVPKYKNIFPHWAGYEIEYPFINYKVQWKDLYRFTKLVVKSKEVTFKKKIAEKFNINNAIDYFLFINLIRATDNLGKNFYVARYDRNMPYFNIPWDLDGILGTIQDGKRISTTDDILSNGLFDRLLKVNPNDYRKRLKNRWFTLRDKEFSNKSLQNYIQGSYDYFEENKIYEREAIVWPTEIPLENHLKYMQSWLSKRLQYLDQYFDALD